MSLTVSQAGTHALRVSGGMVQGAAGSIAISASGGTAPYRFEVVSGQMPPGTHLNSNGRVVGQATAQGSALVTVRATDSSTPPQFADQAITLVVS